MKTTTTTETREMQHARDGEQYWAARRMEASTAKELDHARRMESRAAARYESARRNANR